VLGACGGGVKGPVGGGVLRAREEDENEARSRIGLNVRGKADKGRATVVGLANNLDDLADCC
jgi:hypothetical protein